MNKEDIPKYPDDKYPLFGSIPKLGPEQRDKVKEFNKFILQTWGNLMGPCTTNTYQDKLKKELEKGRFPDKSLKSLFLGEYERSLNIFDQKKRKDENFNKGEVDTIKSISPGNNIDTWNNNDNLTNNSCALKYPELIGLLANTNPAPCPLSSTIDGQSNCNINDNDDPFHLIIRDDDTNRERMEFGVEIIQDDHFKITFNIYDDNDPAAGAHRPFISHKYISQRLTGEIPSKTGFYRDRELNLYFSNSSGSGLTIGLIVKLFCLILVGNKSLNPWVFDDGVTGFNHYPNVFSSIFFLKECGDLFQEIYACIKSQNEDYHNYLTNDIPSILRYFLLMKLFNNGNGYGAWVHNSKEGISFLLGIFESPGTSQPGGGSRRKNTRRKKTRRKKTRRKKTRSKRTKKKLKR